jgi:hypothetical protein
VRTTFRLEAVVIDTIFRLSAYLAQVSGSATYRNAATAAGNWIKNANKNANGIVLDTIHANDCSRSPDSWLFTYVHSTPCQETASLTPPQIQLGQIRGGPHCFVRRHEGFRPDDGVRNINYLPCREPD